MDSHPLNQLFRVEQSERTSDDYLTPKWVFDTLGLDFDLDVAAPPWDTHVPAKRKFTKADDGLSQLWEGRVWMNPPYSKPIEWIAKFMHHSDGVCLVPTSNGQWFGELWAAADGLVVTKHPIIFEGVGSGIPVRTIFAAFGGVCTAAIGRLGRVR